MPLKCPACSTMNFDEAEQCRRCGRSVVYVHPVQSQTAVPTAFRRPGWSLPPLAALVRSLVMGSILLVCAFYAMSVSSSVEQIQTECSSTAQALLDNEYKILTKKRLGVETGKRYQVSYTFTAGGRTVRGKSYMSVEPRDDMVTVHYNPNNPTQSFVELPSDSSFMLLIAGGFGLWGIGAIVWPFLRRQA